MFFIHLSKYIQKHGRNSQSNYTTLILQQISSRLHVHGIENKSNRIISDVWLDSKQKSYTYIYKSSKTGKKNMKTINWRVILYIAFLYSDSWNMKIIILKQ